MTEASTKKSPHQIGDLLYLRYEIGAGMELTGYSSARSLVTLVEGEGESVRYGVVPIERLATPGYFYWCVDSLDGGGKFFMDERRAEPGQEYEPGELYFIQYGLSLAGGPSGHNHEAKSVIVRCERMDDDQFCYFVLPLEPAPDDMEYHSVVAPNFQIFIKPEAA